MEQLTFIQKATMLMNELKVPKKQFNKFGNFYYRSLEDTLECVKPLNLKYGFILTFDETIEFIGDRYYVKAVATLTDGKSSIYGVGHAREQDNKKGMDASQLTGATSSYAKKYALLSLYNLDDNKDADTNEFTSVSQHNSQQPQQQSQQATIETFLNTYKNNFEKLGIDFNLVIRDILAKQNIKDIMQLEPKMIVTEVKTRYLSASKKQKGV